MFANHQPHTAVGKLPVNVAKKLAAAANPAVPMNTSVTVAPSTPPPHPDSHNPSTTWSPVRPAAKSTKSPAPKSTRRHSFASLSSHRQHSFSKTLIEVGTGSTEPTHNLETDLDRMIAATHLLTAYVDGVPVKNYIPVNLSTLEKLLTVGTKDTKSEDPKSLTVSIGDASSTGRASPPLVTLLSHRSPSKNVRRRSLDAHLSVLTASTYLPPATYTGATLSPPSPNKLISGVPSPVALEPVRPVGGKVRQSFKKSTKITIVEKDEKGVKIDETAAAAAAATTTTATTTTAEAPKAGRRRSSFSGVPTPDNVVDVEVDLKIKMRGAGERRKSLSDQRRKSLEDVNAMKRDRVRENMGKEIREIQNSEERQKPVLMWLRAIAVYPSLVQFQLRGVELIRRRKRKNAACVIQRAWRGRTGMNGWSMMMATLKKHKVPLMNRINRKRVAASRLVLRSVLKDAYRHVRFNMWAHLIRVRTGQVQRLVRDFQACQRERVAALVTAWEKVERLDEVRIKMQKECEMSLGVDEQRIIDLGFGKYRCDAEDRHGAITEFLGDVRLRHAKVVTENWFAEKALIDQGGLFGGNVDVETVRGMLRGGEGVKAKIKEEVLEKQEAEKKRRGEKERTERARRGGGPKLKDRGGLRKKWGGMVVFGGYEDKLSGIVVNTFCDRVSVKLGQVQAASAAKKRLEEEERKKVEELGEFAKKLEERGGGKNDKVGTGGVIRH